MQKRKVIATAAAACAISAVPVAIAQGSSTTHGSATARGPARLACGPARWAAPVSRLCTRCSVVLDKAGTAFITQTTDQGKIESVDTSAGSIKVVEGANSVTYQTVTLTIPSSASIDLDGKTSALSDLAAGDRVSVSSSSEGTTVFATDSSFQPTDAAGHGGPLGQAEPGGPGGPAGQSPASHPARPHRPQPRPAADAAAIA